MQWRILFMCKNTSCRVHVDEAEVSVSDRRSCRVLFACLSLKCTWSLLKVKSELCWRQLVPLATLALRGVLFMLHIPTIVNNITFRNPERLSLNGCVPYSPLLAWNNASQWFSIVPNSLLLHTFSGATIQPNFCINSWGSGSIIFKKKKHNNILCCKVPVCCAGQVEVDYSIWCKCDESNLEVWAAEKPGQQKQFTTPLSHHHKDITILGMLTHALESTH